MNNERITRYNSQVDFSLYTGSTYMISNYKHSVSRGILHLKKTYLAFCIFKTARFTDLAIALSLSSNSKMLIIMTTNIDSFFWQCL